MLSRTPHMGYGSHEAHRLAVSRDSLAEQQQGAAPSLRCFATGPRTGPLQLAPRRGPRSPRSCLYAHGWTAGAVMSYSFSMGHLRKIPLYTRRRDADRVKPEYSRMRMVLSATKRYLSTLRPRDVVKRAIKRCNGMKRMNTGKRNQRRALHPLDYALHR